MPATRIKDKERMTKCTLVSVQDDRPVLEGVCGYESEGASRSPLRSAEGWEVAIPKADGVCFSRKNVTTQPLQKQGHSRPKSKGW